MLRPREILFTAKYPGVIEADASWEPAKKKLTITLYDQEGKSLVSKKGRSPVHLVYTYTQEQFNKARIWVIHSELGFHNLLSGR